MLSRFRKARTIMSEQEIDCLLLSPSTDLRYLTGFQGISLERPIFLALTQQEAFFVLPGFELENLPGDIREHTVCVTWEEDESAYEKFRKVFSGRDVRKAAVGNQMQAVMFYHFQKTFPEWSWLPGEIVMDTVRSRKEEEEYQMLSLAQELSARAFLELLEERFEGAEELEIAEKLNRNMRKQGLICEGIPLVAAGAGSALAHHQADHTVIRRGDAVIIDFGGIYKGYHADITRTVFVGETSDKFEKIYRIVREANETARMAARPGITGAQLDQTARNVIADAGYGAYFTHRLGHGIGLDIHEAPFIVKGNQKPLQEGNVFSDEPGIYLPGRFGIRLEDVLVIRETGAECITPLTHDIIKVH